MQYSTRGLAPLPNSLPQPFSPGRKFNTSCLDASDPRAGPCYGVAGRPSYKAERARTQRNVSDISQIKNIGGGSVLMPAKLPSNIDFDASTIGSKTNCTVVTHLCEIYPGFANNEGDGLYYINDTFLNCTRGKAGMNFEDTLSGAAYPFNSLTAFISVDYFTDGTMSVLNGSWTNGSTWWSTVLFTVEEDYVSDNATLNALINTLNSVSRELPQSSLRLVNIKNSVSPNQQVYLESKPNPIPDVSGLVPDLSGEKTYGGIMSCVTKLSDVVGTFHDGFVTFRTPIDHEREQRYSFINGNITNDLWTLMNQSEGTTVSQFAIVVENDPGLQHGIRTAVANAQKAEDIGVNCGKSFNTSVLSSTIGLIIDAPPTNVTSSVTLQVTPRSSHSLSLICFMLSSAPLSSSSPLSPSTEKAA